MSISCTKFKSEIDRLEDLIAAGSSKQDKLKTCSGADMPGGTKVPSCAEMEQAIQDSVSVEVADGQTITGTGASADPFKVAKAPALENGNWQVKPTADGKLGFYCNGTLVASLDCAGNFTAIGNITGYCTP